MRCSECGDGSGCGDSCLCACHYSFRSWLWVGVFNAAVVAALFASAWALSR